MVYIGSAVTDQIGMLSLHNKTSGPYSCREMSSPSCELCSMKIDYGLNNCQVMLTIYMIAIDFVNISNCRKCFTNGTAFWADMVTFTRNTDDVKQTRQS